METILLLLLCAGVRSQSYQLLTGGHLREFYLSNTKMNWSDARAYCKNNFTNLVTVYSPDNNFSVPRASPSWIGLHRRNPIQFWSNGEPVDYRLNLTDTTDTKCAKVTTNNNITWNNCTNRLPFVCYNNGSGSSSRYILIPDWMSWCKARSYCRQRHTDLAVIRNQSQYDEVMGIKSKVSFWVGLKSDPWEWVNEACSDYLNIELKKQCVNLIVEKMYPKECDTSLKALCYKDLAKVEIIYQKLNWEEALNYCSANHSQMLTITSQQDQWVVEDHLRSAGVSGHLWVGLRQSHIFGFWIWMSDHTVKWHNWKGGQAPEMPLSNNCGAVSMEDFKWSDQNCFVKHYFACEKVV